MPRAICGTYFAIQGALVLVWWVLLLARPDVARYFYPESWPVVGLFVFMLPDLVLIVGGSLVSSALVFRRRPGAPFALWLVAGAVSYASLFCLAVWLATGTASLAVALMAPAMALSLLFAIGASRI